MLKTEKVEIVKSDDLLDFFIKLDNHKSRRRIFSQLVELGFMEHDVNKYKIDKLLEHEDEYHQALGKEMLSREIDELYLLF